MYRYFLNISGENLNGIYSAAERKKEMPAHREEIEHAKEEGVKFVLLTSPL